MIIKILSQPYPLILDRKHHIKMALYVSIFVTFFLLFFKPFGIGNYQRSGLNFRIAGYGPITFVTLMLVFYVSGRIKRQPDEERWTTGKEILRQILYIVALGIANVFYTHYVFGLNFSVRAFVNFQVFTLLIGVFPVTFFVLANHFRLLHRNEKSAELLTGEIRRHRVESSHELPEAIPGKSETIRLTSENEKEVVDLHVDDLILIESADNYSTVYFLQNGKIQNKLLRSSLKRLELQAQHENLLRCHRTYIVNLKKVITVQGNAQGYRLRFHGFDQAFPVSRALNDTIRERLHHLAQG